MSEFIGCLAPDARWHDRRTRWRVIVLVILVPIVGWLLAVQRLSVLEAGGALVFLGLSAAVVIDRVVDGRRPVASEVAAAIDAVASAPAGGNTQATGRP